MPLPEIKITCLLCNKKLEGKLDIKMVEKLLKEWHYVEINFTDWGLKGYVCNECYKKFFEKYFSEA